MEEKGKRVLTEAQKVEQSILTKFRKGIWRQFVKAVDEYQLIEENDKIAVCMSGGKDSFVLAKCMQELKRHGKVSFDLIFLVMDPGYSIEHRNLIIENAKKLEIPITMFSSNIFDSVHEIKDNPCYICARMRRGYLYHKAKDLGCNKIALGHHFDDVIETTLLSIFYGGEFKTMLPKLHSENYEGMELIRPLYYVKEDSIIAFKNYHQLNFLNCACRFTKESNEKEEKSKRLEMKRLIQWFRQKDGHIDMNIFQSSKNVNLSAILGYHKENEVHSFLDDYQNNEK